MANKNLTASATLIRDQWTATAALVWAATDTGVITINNRNLSVVMGATTNTVTLVAAELARAWEGQASIDSSVKSPIGGGVTIPEMMAITATSVAGVVTLTADDGQPNVITSSETTIGSGTLTIANSVVGTGPHHWDNALNWAEGAVPVATNDVLIDRPVQMLYGLDANTVTLTSLTIGPKCTSVTRIGLPVRNALGYEEYRNTQLKISATTFTDYGTAGLIRWNAGTVQTTASMYGSTIEWVGTHASNVWNCYGGTLRLAAFLGELCTVATLRQTTGVVIAGVNATLGAIVKSGGSLDVASSSTSLISMAGLTVIRGGTHTALTTGEGETRVYGSSVITTWRLNNATGFAEVNVTWGTISKMGGDLTINSGGTTLSSFGGTTRINAGAISGVTTIRKGICYFGGTGAIANLVASGCTLNFDAGTTASITISASTIASDVIVIDTANRAVWS